MLFHQSLCIWRFITNFLVLFLFIIYILLILRLFFLVSHQLLIFELIFLWFHFHSFNNIPVSLLVLHIILYFRFIDQRCFLIFLDRNFRVFDNLNFVFQVQFIPIGTFVLFNSLFLFERFLRLQLKLAYGILTFLFNGIKVKILVTITI